MYETHDTYFGNSAVPNIPTISNVIRISDTSIKVFWVPLTPDEARGVLTELQIAYQPNLNNTCISIDEENMQLMTIEENIDTQSVAVINGLVKNEEYCVGIQVSTTAGESGYSNTLKAHCKPYHVIWTPTIEPNPFSPPQISPPLFTINILAVVPSDVYVQIRLKLPEDEDCSLYIVSEETSPYSYHNS